MRKLKPIFKAVLALGLLSGSTVVLAQYDYQLVDSPDAADTQVFGINDSGKVAGTGFDDLADYPFIYNSKKDTFADVDLPAGYDFISTLDISDSGVVVGGVFSLDTDTGSGFIRNKKGEFAVFDHPDALSQTSARSINNKGLVTGFRDIPHPLFGDTIAGYIYNPKKGTFTDIIPANEHSQSIAQGINSKGEVVGSALFLDAEDPCDAGNIGFKRYGWLRSKNGDLTYFQVNGQRTAARGINDSGTIVGFAPDPADGIPKGFVVELDGTQCQDITVDSADLLLYPGFDVLYAQDINNAGVISGQTDDEFSHGFIATPQ